MFSMPLPVLPAEVCRWSDLAEQALRTRVCWRTRTLTATQFKTSPFRRSSWTTMLEVRSLVTNRVGDALSPGIRAQFWKTNAHRDRMSAVVVPEPRWRQRLRRCLTALMASGPRRSVVTSGMANAVIWE